MLEPRVTIGLIGRLAAMPVAYLVLWFTSLIMGIALIALLRSRWGQSRPLQKCAVLSLLVHVVLAWVAMTVRIVGGDGDGNGGDMGPSIRVHMVEDAAEGPVLAMAGTELPPLDTAPPLLEIPPEEKQTLPEADPAPPTPTGESSASKTDVTTEADSAPEPTKEEAAKSMELEHMANSPNSAVPQPPSAVDQTTKPSVSAEPAAEVGATPVTVAASLPTAPQATTPYSLRNAPGRLGLVEQQGGSGRTESAVSDALRWLSAAQSPDGGWDADEYGSGQEQMVLNQNRGGAGRNADTGVSALALLAFLGAGHSHLHGD